MESHRSFLAFRQVFSTLTRFSKWTELSSSSSQRFCTSRLSMESPKETDNQCGKTKQNPIRGKTPIGKLDELEEGQHPFREKEPLKPWPGGVNPHTGEIGGPKGPEPTRYGDWERKGRVSDF